MLLPFLSLESSSWLQNKKSRGCPWDTGLYGEPGTWSSGFGLMATCAVSRARPHCPLKTFPCYLEIILSYFAFLDELLCQMLAINSEQILRTGWIQVELQNWCSKAQGGITINIWSFCPFKRKYGRKLGPHLIKAKPEMWRPTRSDAQTEDICLHNAVLSPTSLVFPLF